MADTTFNWPLFLRAFADELASNQLHHNSGPHHVLQAVSHAILVAVRKAEVPRG